MQENSKTVVNLLWTGGWDSTFRLLQLLLVKKRKVQPYYIIDSDRLSTQMELWTMKEIKKRIIRDFPFAIELFLPVKYKDLFDIRPNERISESYRNLNKNSFFGRQYEWLAFFAEDENISDFELSIENFDTGAFKIIAKYVDKNRIGSEEDHYEISRKFKGTDVFEVFNRFRFPLIQLTKLDMQRIAREEGFIDYLMDTWFCHNPRKNGKPCGVCNPCIGVITGGLRSRLPIISRLRYHLRAYITKKHFKKKFPTIYSFGVNIKHKVFFNYLY